MTENYMYLIKINCNRTLSLIELHLGFEMLAMHVF